MANRIEGWIALRWKRIVGIAGFLFIAIIVAAYVILSTYDYNTFKLFIAEDRRKGPLPLRHRSR